MIVDPFPNVVRDSLASCRMTSGGFVIFNGVMSCTTDNVFLQDLKTCITLCHVKYSLLFRIFATHRTSCHVHEYSFRTLHHLSQPCPRSGRERGNGHLHCHALMTCLGLVG